MTSGSAHAAPRRALRGWSESRSRKCRRSRSPWERLALHCSKHLPGNICAGWVAFAVPPGTGRPGRPWREGSSPARPREPAWLSAGCWHRFLLPAGPHQARVLITGRPLVLRGRGRWARRVEQGHLETDASRGSETEAKTTGTASLQSPLSHPGARRGTRGRSLWPRATVTRVTLSLALIGVNREQESPYLWLAPCQMTLGP